MGDWDNEERGDRKYLILGEEERLINTLNESLMDYNTIPANLKMNLVFFTDAIAHIAKINRILRQDRGNALLVGVGGSGRRSLARLSAYMQEITTFSIEITKNYREKEWHENLKELLRNAGAERQKMMFLFSDTQIVYESFLEDINNILNSGEVPNLFPQDEMEGIVGDLRSYAKEKFNRESRDQIV